MTLMRYPGSKDYHLKFILPEIDALLTDKIVEPFAGTAALTFHLLKRGRLSHYWINDIDPSIVKLWWAVKNRAKELADLIYDYQPKAEDFYRFKAEPGDHIDNLTKAFHTIVLHQISYSGLGVKAGSPIGGRHQRGSYKVDVRWNGTRIADKVLELSQLLNSVPGLITGSEWTVPVGAPTRGAFVYLDPPYFEVGPNLYEFGSIDHAGLSWEVKHLKAPWALSYNAHPTIQQLYDGCRIVPIRSKSQLNSRESGDILILKE